MRSRATVRLAGAVVGALAVLAAGCSSSGPDTHSSPAAKVTPTESPVNVPVKIRTVSGVGKILVNSHGMALYANDVETSTSTLKCIGECATEWPPLMVSGAVPKEIAGIKGTFSLVNRPPRGKQLALNGHPLYSFDRDTAPGTVHGNGFIDHGAGTTLTWHVVTPSGVVIKPTVKPSASPR